MNNRVAEVSAEYRVETFKNAVPVGYKQTEVGVIPEDWKLITIEGAMKEKLILDQMDGNHGELYPKSYEFSDFGVPYIGATDFEGGGVDFKNCKYLPEKRAKLFKKGISRNGDVLFAHNATVGPVALLETDFDFVIVSTTATYYRCDLSALSNKYLGAYFQSSFFIKQYFSVMSQSTRNQVPILAQRKFTIVIPEIEEQTAIANALSDVDALIGSLEKLINKKQAIKTASMQQLLTGKTRLPQFATHPDGKPKGSKQSELGEIPEDWDVKVLANICSMKSGASITSEGISDSGKYSCYGGNGLRGYTQNFTHDGDFALIGRQGALCGNVVNVKGQFFASEHAIVVTPHQKTRIDWLAYILYRMNLNQYSESSAQPGLSVSKLLVFKILCPSYEEQTAIATILSDMDTEIQTLEQRLSKTRHIKQGMMQELLTGKTRLV